MPRLSNTFFNIKQAILRRIVQKHEEKSRVEKPLVVAALDVDPLINPKTSPIYIKFPTDVAVQAPPRVHAPQNLSRDTLPLSPPASPVPSSLFTHRNASTGTTLTIPLPPYTPSLQCCDIDVRNDQHGIIDTQGDFVAFLRDVDKDIPCSGDFTRKPLEVTAKRSVFWGCIEKPSPSQLEIGIVVPARGPDTEAASFIFDFDVVDFTPLVKYLAKETRRRRWDDIVLLSNVYPEEIHDQASFNSWLMWSMGRNASEDLMLYAL